MKKLKVLVIGDLHGRKEYVTNAYEKYKKEKYDRIIFLGDYVDSYDRSGEDILATVQQTIDIKKELGDKCILLIGNHDYQYMFYPSGTCSGFRVELLSSLKYLFNENRNLYQAAHQIKNFVFTHAGIQEKWYNSRIQTIENYSKLLGYEKLNIENIAEILNAILVSKDYHKLCDIGFYRGGRDLGGIFWCDENEIMQNNPIKNLHQIIGHTPQKFIHTETKFNGSHYNNTSVTFCDVLGHEEKYYILEI